MDAYYVVHCPPSHFELRAEYAACSVPSLNPNADAGYPDGDLMSHFL